MHNLLREEDAVKVEFMSGTIETATNRYAEDLTEMVGQIDS